MINRFQLRNGYGLSLLGDNDVLYVVQNVVVLFLSERVFGFGRDGIRASFRPGTIPIVNSCAMD